MNHKITNINWDGILQLSKQIPYSESDEIIKFVKGRDKLPTTFKELMSKVKMIFNG